MKIKNPLISEEYSPWTALKITVCGNDDLAFMEDIDPGKLADLIKDLGASKKNLIISGEFVSNENTLFELHTLCHHLSEEGWTILLDVDLSWGEIVKKESRLSFALQLLILSHIDIIRDKDGKLIDIRESLIWSKAVKWKKASLLNRLTQRILGGKHNV